MKKLLLYLTLLGLAFTAVPNTFSESQITLVNVPILSSYPGATADGAIQLCCSTEMSNLKEFFFSEGLPFRRDLVHVVEGLLCHLHFQPTLPGFRAAPEDYPIQALKFSVDSLRFVTPSAHGDSDALGVIKSVLEKIEVPLSVEINLPFSHDPKFYLKAIREHFPKTVHEITLRDQGKNQASLHWAQDLFKPGFHNNQRKILVPRRLFEGETWLADSYDGLIETLATSKNVVRSQLAWEGGDFQFTLHPNDADKLVLYYGAKAKSYWGEALTPQEYEYILCLEFGADQAVDLSGLAPHVDYLVAFLPKDRIVLVSEPDSGSQQLAQIVLGKLLADFGSEKPPHLRGLARLLSQPIPDLSEAERLLAEAWAGSPEWEFSINLPLFNRLRSFVSSICPDQQNCFEPANQLAMLDRDPDLLGHWIREAKVHNARAERVKAYRSLIENVISEVPEKVLNRLEEKIIQLQALGFRVIRVPRTGIGFEKDRIWPGISYVNALIVDRMIFMPEFGLGEFEDRIFSELRYRLPPGYEVIPIPAADVLVKSGGIHCLAAVIRSRGS